METMISNLPTMSQSVAADQAYERVDAILRAYGFSHPAIRARYCLRFLEEASEQLVADGNCLESLAARIAVDRIRRGVDAIIVASGYSLDSINRNSFYLALQAAAFPRKQPDVILECEEPNEELCAQIRSYYESQSKPTLRRISMGASPLRFDAIDEVTGTTGRFLQRNPVLRFCLKFIFVGLTLYLVYILAK